MNFTVVTPAAGGFITAYPYGGALPVAATVNFQTGDIARGDFTIAKVTQTGADHLSIYSSSLTDVVGDVVGFFSKPLAQGSLECINTAIKITNIPTQSYLTENANACAAGYLTTSVTCDGSTGVYINGSGMINNDPSNGAYCRYVNTAGVDRITVTSSTCCRIPGR